MKIFVLIFFHLCAVAQAQPCINVEYDFIRFYKNSGSRMRQPARLYHAENKSIFIYGKSDKIGTQYQNSNGENIEFDVNKMDNNLIVPPSYSFDTIGKLFLKDFLKKTLRFRVHDNPLVFVSEEKLPQLKWNITTEKKMIGKFNCLLAKTSFRGRVFSAWFTPEIPINDGPWKLHGLPGLILEAIDDQQEYQFTLKSINYPCQTKENFRIPETGATVMDWETYKTKSEKMAHDAYIRKFNSIDYGRDANVTITRPKTPQLEKNYND